MPVQKKSGNLLKAQRKSAPQLQPVYSSQGQIGVLRPRWRLRLPGHWQFNHPSSSIIGGHPWLTSSFGGRARILTFVEMQSVHSTTPPTETRKRRTNQTTIYIVKHIKQLKSNADKIKHGLFSVLFFPPLWVKFCFLIIWKQSRENKRFSFRHWKIHGFFFLLLLSEIVCAKTWSEGWVENETKRNEKKRTETKRKERNK